jgi:hypothetical protein
VAFIGLSIEPAVRFLKMMLLKVFTVYPRVMDTLGWVHERIADSTEEHCSHRFHG